MKLNRLAAVSRLMRLFLFGMSVTVLDSERALLLLPQPAAASLSAAIATAATAASAAANADLTTRHYQADNGSVRHSSAACPVCACTPRGTRTRHSAGAGIGVGAPVPAGAAVHPSIA